MLVLLNRSGISEFAFFQRADWHWLAPTLLFALMGSIGLVGAWCGAWASSKVTKLRRVRVETERARHR
jgi:hypothetical protein